jgi:hypothetical protein
MTQTSECRQQEELVRRCQKAVETIEAVLHKPPREPRQIVDFGERPIVRLRDCLIEHYRQAEDSPEKANLRYALEQANIALSLITGVEYPEAGIQEKPLQEARDILKGLFPTLERIVLS